MTEKSIELGVTDAFSSGILPIPAAWNPATEAFSAKPHIIARRDRPLAWGSDVLKAIEDLLKLQQNWDSYGAHSVDLNSIIKARDFASTLSFFVGIDPPLVTATPSGCVGFCWDKGDWSLDVSIDGTGLIKYVFLDEQNPQRDIDSSTSDYQNLLPLLTQW